MKLGIFHFQVLYNVLENIHFIYDEDELATSILSKVSEALNAEAGSIFKVLPDGAIYPLAAYGAPIESLRKLKFATGQGVVGWVAQYMQPVKVDNPKLDTRFATSTDSTTGFKTRCIVAAPILAKGKVVGIIEFLNRRDGPFAIPDLELISMIGREIGIAFENVALIKKIEERRAFEEAIINNLSAGILVVDKESRLLEANPSAKTILGAELDVTQPAPTPIQSFLPNLAEFKKVVQQLAAAETPVARQEVVLALNGREAVIGYSGMPIKAKDGARLGSALLFQDITAFVRKSKG